MAETSKSFIKKFVGFSLVTWIGFALSFISAPISTRLFDPSVLGKINIFNTYTNLFGIFILIGLDQAFARFYYERPNNRSIGYLFTFCFSITYALIFCFIVLSIPIRGWLSGFLFQETGNLLLYLFYGSVWCMATLRFLNLSYRMEKDIKLYTIQGVLIALVSKILYIGVGFWDTSYKPALIVLTASHVMLAVIFLIIQRSRFERIHEIDKVFTHEMFHYALPLIPVSILTWANTSIPQVIMQNTMDYTSIGVFTSAVALANIILLVQAGFNTFWLPYTYENYQTQTGQFFKVHKYLLCVLTLLALAVILSQDIIFLVLGEKYRAAKSFFPFLILGPISYIIGETTGMGIDLSKKTYLNIVVFCSSVFVNVLMCLMLPKYMGIPGIAIATAIAAIVSVILKTYLGQKTYVAVHSYRYMVYTIVIIIISSFITLWCDSLLYRNLAVSTLLLVSFIFYKSEIKGLLVIAKSFIKK